MCTLKADTRALLQRKIKVVGELHMAERRYPCWFYSASVCIAMG